MLFLNACNDEFDVGNIGELDITISDYNSSVDFSSFCKYYIDEEINYPEDTKEMSSSTSSALYSYTETQMNALNYEKVDTKAEADIVVNYYLASSDYVSINSWYYQGSYWWWGYNDGWTIYSPTYNSYYMYSAGSLITTLTDRTLSDSETNPRPYWFSLMNGVVENNQIDNRLRIQQSLNQAFKQSAYLARTSACSP